MSRPAGRADDRLEVELAALVEQAERSADRFAYRSRLLLDAAAEGLIDYLTCPACRALVPLGPGATWPDVCPRCGRCV